MKTKLLAALMILAMLTSGIVSPTGAATQDEIDQAIADGLAWLAAQQSANGQIGSGYPLADTATAIVAFGNEGHFPGGGTTYSPVVERALDYVFQFCYISSINPQIHGNPDTNGNGYGIGFSQSSGVYETGIVMQAIVASNTPSRVVTTGSCAGMTYRDVLTDTADWVAWAQIDGGSGRGGWRYGVYNNASGAGDNSVAQWPVLGLVAAEQWGVFAPQFVKDELSILIDYIQNDSSGGSGYDSPGYLVTVSKTGGLLVEMHYVGDDPNTGRAQAALSFINDHWDEAPSGWYGNKGHSYAMFSIFKGLELMGVSTIPNALATPDTPAGDWYGDYAHYLANSQAHTVSGQGYWTGYYYWDNWLTTGWYIVILQATVLPVTATVDVPGGGCACDAVAFAITVNYSVERFPVNGTLALYEDDVLFDSIPLVDFQGSASATFTVVSDTPGSHIWKAVLSATGGGTSFTVEDSGVVNVYETPRAAGIPDQVTPFQAFDLDDYLTYGGDLPVMWSVSGVPGSWTATIDADNVVTIVAPHDDPPADLTFTAGVECCTGVICSDGDTATFTPNQPPDCTEAYPSANTIWPPNHQFVPIDVMGVSDPDGDAVSITITSIWQDEPVDTYGDGRFTPDGMGVGTSTAQVRAERAGTPRVPGNGRVYHIYFSADDGRGGVCTGEVRVAVPHDQNKPAVDDGALYDSTLLAP